MRSVIGKYSPLHYSEIQCNATANVDTLLTQRQATETTVGKTNWLGSSTNSKGSEQVSKVALYYVEQTVSVHIVLFYVLAQMFLLVSLIRTHFNTLCFVQVKVNDTVRLWQGDKYNNNNNNNKSFSFPVDLHFGRIYNEDK